MTFRLEYPQGATPLDPDEITGLIPSHISTQGELDEAEQANILKARHWALSQKKDILSDTFVRGLHKRMFIEVWRWAGQYRTTGKNLGVPAHQIPTSLRELCTSAEYWINHGTYNWDELAARFHHRLVLIHAFANGNGRHARLMTDILMRTHGQFALTWGAGRSSKEIGRDGDAREAYLAALREADERRFEKLIEFIRS